MVCDRRMRVFKGHHLAGTGFSVSGYIMLLRDLRLDGDFLCEAESFSKLKITIFESGSVNCNVVCAFLGAGHSIRQVRAQK